MTAADPVERALALEQNVALFAGPGAGKTYSLVTLCLHLLGGGREDGLPVRTSQLFMLTFTDKAAAEMRARLRQRLDALARRQRLHSILARAFASFRVPGRAQDGQNAKSAHEDGSFS